MDSTHFPDGSLVEVRFEADGDDGVTYVAPPKIVEVKNRATLFNRADFSTSNGGFGALRIFNELTDSNYDRMVEASTGWSAAGVLAELGDAAIHYVNTHGNVDLHTSDSDELCEGCDEYICPGPEWGTEFDYESWRTIINGTGLAPLNTSAKPPTHLFLLDACCAGLNNNFIRIMWPYADYYGGWVRNKAYCCWSGTIYVHEAENRMGLLIPYLRGGDTIHLARDQMIDDCIQNPELVHIDTGTGMRSVSMTTDYPVWGNYYVRVKNVYTGSDNTPPTVWYY